MACGFGDWVAYNGSLAIRRQVAQINSWIDNGGILEVILPPLDKKDFQFRIGLCDSACSYASCSSTSRKDNVDVTD